MSILRFLDGKPKNASLCVPAILARTTTFFPSWRMSSMVSFRSGKVVVQDLLEERWIFLAKRLVPKRDGFFVSIHIFVLVGVVVFGIHERTGCEIEESKQIRFHRRKFRRRDVSSSTKAPPSPRMRELFAP